MRGAAGVLLAAIAQKGERAAGAWHAEWERLRDALALTGAAAVSVREVLEGLEGRPQRMLDNLRLTGGLLMAEAVTSAMAGTAGRLRAHHLVEAASRRAAGRARPLRDELVEDGAVMAHITPEALDRALDPAGYLGSADAFVGRALARYGREGRR